MKEIGELIDKVLLIGITLTDENDDLIAQIQVFGPIIRVNANGITIVRNETDTEFVIPPDLEHIRAADPGEYRMKSTGEIVVDPDYISTWTVSGANTESVEKYSKVGFGRFEQQEL